MTRPLAVEPTLALFDPFDLSIPEVSSVPDDTRRPKKPSRKKASSKMVDPLRPAVIRLTPDAVIYSAMSRKTLLRYHRAGRLPMINEDRRYRVFVSDLDALMAALRKKKP